MAKKSISKVANKRELFWWLPEVMPLLVILAVALSATYFVVQYHGSMSFDFSQKAAGRTIVDVIQLENKYAGGFKAVVNAYLESIDVRDSGFIVKTEQLKKRLLALVVPAKYRDQHLAVVLTLDKMETDSQQGDWQAVAAEMEKIKQNCQSF